MGVMDFFKKIVYAGVEPGAVTNNNTESALFLDDVPVFSQYGEDIYASDLVQNCIDVIATECSKLMPQHIRIDADGMQHRPTSSINRLFKVSPNPLMTTRDFLEKTIWLLYLNYNCFIYPTYDLYRDRNGVLRKNYTGFYPLNPTEVTFEQDRAGNLFVRMLFKQGHEYVLNYTNLIHLRKKFSVNDVMGGGRNGQPDNNALVSVLNTNSTIIEGLGKAVKSTLTVRGIVKTNTVLNDADQTKEREKFEAKMLATESGILPLDLKAEYIPINSTPTILDDEVLKFVESKIINWYGVSLPILTGDFTDDQYQAFYEKTLEPLLISLGQAFTKCLFSQRELDIGNEIIFYPKNMMYLSTKAKLDIIKITGEQGLLTNDQKLMLLGYPALGGEEGKMRTQSLNYIDTRLVAEYQSARVSTPAPAPQNNNQIETDDEEGDDDNAENNE